MKPKRGTSTSTINFIQTCILNKITNLFDAASIDKNHHLLDGEHYQSDGSSHYQHDKRCFQNEFKMHKKCMKHA